MFLLAIFEMQGEANIETLPQYIFVFVHEVLIKIIVIFPLPRKANPRLIDSKPKYSPEIYLPLSLQNISSTRSKNNRCERVGHQMKATSHAILLLLQPHGRKKKFVVKYSAFRAQSFFPPPIPCRNIWFEPCFFTLRVSSELMSLP